MRKVFNKALAGVTSATLIATLALGVNFTSTVKADEAKSADTDSKQSNNRIYIEY